MIRFVFLLVFIATKVVVAEYDIQVVQSSSSSKRALLGGKVISSAVVNLSAQLSGDIVKVNGIEGSYFNKGDEIIVIEQDAVKAKRDSAVAEVLNAKEALKNSRVKYSQSIVSPDSDQMFGGMFNTFTNPMNRMFGSGDVDFDRYANRTNKFTELQKSKNRLKQAQLRLKQVEETLKDTRIIAPFDGVIVKKNVNTGDTVHVGQSLLKFSNLKQLQVEVNVPSRLMHNLQVNKTYRVKIDILNKIIFAKLTQIYPIADNTKHSIKVKLNLPSNINILPGVYAELELTGSKSKVSVPSIPKSAILWRSSLPSVFIVDKYNKAELRFIRLGDDIDIKNIGVLSGLKVGQRVIANPDVFLVSGVSI